MYFETLSDKVQTNIELYDRSVEGLSLALCFIVRLLIFNIVSNIIKHSVGGNAIVFILLHTIYITGVNFVRYFDSKFTYLFLFSSM